MNKQISINKMSEQMGLTSRTLRFWESEHLFTSDRDVDSGWRTYDEHAILCIKITAFLRKMGVSIRKIKKVIEDMSMDALYHVISEELENLDADAKVMIERRMKLEQMRIFLLQQKNVTINDENFEQMQVFHSNLESIREVRTMIDYKTSDFMKIVTLSPMRMVYHIAVSANPEDEAMKPVLDWLKSENLMGTARLFGGNVKPMPDEEGDPYGYAFYASIPEAIAIPEHLNEIRLPGGIYATIDSTDDIGGSWGQLMKELSVNTKYESDDLRVCLEEHIRNDNPDGCENMYSLRLMEPVKLK